jgi:hypothetical protein
MTKPGFEPRNESRTLYPLHHQNPLEIQCFLFEKKPFRSILNICGVTLVNYFFGELSNFGDLTVIF